MENIPSEGNQEDHDKDDMDFEFVLDNIVK